ncbi:MAG: histidine kinase [Bacteroidetes bacterium]|nr:histidine kinase [Bacteroidota bacterium]
MNATYKPESPYFTRVELADIWSQLQEEDKVWSVNTELNESTLPESDTAILRNFGVALAVPVSSGRGEPVGVLVLGRKARRRAVYNLEDVEMLKALCGQLAVASERLGLIEREKALVRESAEAQLAALRAQINPHFLFNALNTIAALIQEKPEEAEDTVQQLAGLFRYVLQTGSRTFVPLSEELRLVRQYLRIEQARFADKMTVEEAWDESLNDVSVPAFVVQTLVENAVKHGIERKRGGGTIRLSSRRREDGSVEITVADTGVGIPALFADTSGAVSGAAENKTTPAFFGIGLRNVADRLEQLYGRTDLLDMTSDPDRGTVVRLVLPAETPIT